MSHKLNFDVCVGGGGSPIYDFLLVINGDICAISSCFGDVRI